MHIKLRGLSPQANYTDRATAACRAKLVSTFAVRGCRVVSAMDSHSRILSFWTGDIYIYIYIYILLNTRDWLENLKGRDCSIDLDIE
jgi:hypothetical protein